MMKRVRSLILAAAALSLAFPQAAEAQKKDLPPEIELFGRLIQGGKSFEAYLKNVQTEFADLGTGGETIVRADIATHERMATAQARLFLAMQMLGMDLDADGYVTREEMGEWYDYQHRADRGNRSLQQGNGRAGLRDRNVAMWMKRDADGDQRVSLAESMAMPGLDSPESQVLNRRNRGEARRAELALRFDSNGDGALTLTEFHAVAEAVFNTADTDNDAQISQEEAKSFRENPPEVSVSTLRAAEESQRLRAKAEADAKVAEQAKADAVCAMPKASPEAQVILTGIYEAESLSNVAIGTQDETVTTATLTIEPGDTRLYIVIASYDPLIWRVSGAVERIERLVLGSLIAKKGDDPKNRTPLVGATGVPADRVAFLAPANCLSYFTESPSVDAAQAAAIVRQKAGKEPTIVVSEYSLDDVSLPSGKTSSLKGKQRGGWPLIVVPGQGALRITGEDGSMTVTRESGLAESELRRFNPGGVVEIDPAKVVASAPVEPYDVLPQQAGLVQLLQEGALRKNRSGEYLIQKKMRFPPGLYGGHSVTFLLLRGVPMPEGNPGHSTVVSEETGEVLAGWKRP